jgi:DNA replication protein DnaC
MQNTKLVTIKEYLERVYSKRSEEKKDWTFEKYGLYLNDYLNSQLRVPLRFQLTADTDIPKEVMEKLQNMKNDNKGVYLYGNCGTGKTHILYAVAKLLWVNGFIVVGEYKTSREIKVTNITDLFSKARNTFDNDSQGNLEDIIYTKNILLLDDIGVEKVSEWTLEVAYRLINHRYEEMKPTFFASNYSIKEISEKLDDRIASRIVGMCNIVKLEGSDKRII